MNNNKDLVEYKQINTQHIQGFFEDNLFCECQYKEDEKLSILSWYGYIAENIIIDAYINMGIFAKQNNWHVIKTLTNISKIEGSFHKINEWLVKNYLPKMVERGFKYSAIVNSKDFFSILATEDQADLIDGLYVNEIFDNYEEAYQWIITQPI